MTVQLLQTLSLIAFIPAGALLLVSIALFFLFNIPKVFGEVSGSTARKAIESIRQQNEQTGNKAYRPSPVNAERGKITDKITPSGKLEQRIGNAGVSVGTAKLQTDELESPVNETTVLENVATETTVLNASSVNTTALDNFSLPYSGNSPVDSTVWMNFSIEFEIEYLGSAEIIQ